MNALALLTPLLTAAALGLLGPKLARRLPPREASWLISCGSAVAALSAAGGLAVVAAVLVGQLPELAALGHWSPPVLRADAPTEPGIAALALAALCAAAGAALLVAAREVLALRSARRSCRRLAGPEGELAVVDGPGAGAIAVPGRPGRILVSRSLLATLGPEERRVLLAHERAHLAHAHHRHRALVAVAVAINPLLRPLRGAVTLATERWADEEAALEIGDRRRVAEILARVALLGDRLPPLAGGGLAGAGFADAAVVDRVAALLASAPRRSVTVWTGLAVVLLVAGAVAASGLAAEIENVFELAGHAYGAV